MPEMQDDQPAWMMRPTDEAHNVEALRQLLEDVPPPPIVVEYFGGVGGMTRMLAEQYPQSKMIAWDSDPQCCELILSKVPRASVYCSDSVQYLTPPPGAGVIMDFNKLTIKRFRDNYSGWRSAIDRVMASLPAFVTITDSAKVRLQLHFETYGLSSRSTAEYRIAFNNELCLRYGGTVRSVESKRAFMFLWRPL